MLRSAYKSDVGRVRAVNEDRVAVQEGQAFGTLAIVADGMGGHQAGDTASQITIELVQEALLRLTPALDRAGLAEQLADAIREANAKVFEVSMVKEHYRGMGTTITAALADQERILIGHIGDSRAYFINHQKVEQITEDHTLVNELLKTGQITSEEAVNHPRRNVLTRALGTDPEVEVDITDVEWTVGDMVLLCSDGLSNMVPLEQLVALVRGEGTIEEKVNRLVEIANDAGGDDNITVVLLSNE